APQDAFPDPEERWAGLGRDLAGVAVGRWLRRFLFGHAELPRQRPFRPHVLERGRYHDSSERKQGASGGWYLNREPREVAGRHSASCRASASSNSLSCSSTCTL